MVDPHRHGYSYHDSGEKVDGRLQYSYNARLGTNHILDIRYVKNKSKLGQGSIRSSPRYGLSTPYRLIIRNSAFFDKSFRAFPKLNFFD